MVTHAAANSRLVTNGTNSTALDLIKGLSMPIRLIAGTGDTIVPYASNQAMYENATNAPTQLVAIQGAGHCAFINRGPSPPTRTERTVLTPRSIVDHFCSFVASFDGQLICKSPYAAPNPFPAPQHGP